MSAEIKIHCKYDDLLDPNKLKNHVKNRNKHGQDQIERLSEMYSYHGIRHPIIVSKLSGMVVAGHCRKLAALRIGMKTFPVVYQDFENSDSEYAFLQADNAIAEWAELDLISIKQDLGDLSDDFDLSMLGIKNMVQDLPDSAEFDPFADDGDDTKQKLCPHCGEAI